MFGCSNKSVDDVFIIKNVLIDQEILLEKNSKKDHVVSFYIKGSGEVSGEGEGELILILNDKPYKTEIIKNDFEFKWSGDWYANSDLIIYKPKTIVLGNIRLGYRFDYLNK